MSHPIDMWNASTGYANQVGNPLKGVSNIAHIGANTIGSLSANVQNVVANILNIPGNALSIFRSSKTNGETAGNALGKATLGSIVQTVRAVTTSIDAAASGARESYRGAQSVAQTGVYTTLGNIPVLGPAIGKVYDAISAIPGAPLAALNYITGAIKDGVDKFGEQTSLTQFNTSAGKGPLSEAPPTYGTIRI